MLGMAYKQVLALTHCGLIESQRVGDKGRRGNRMELLDSDVELMRSHRVRLATYRRGRIMDRVKQERIDRINELIDTGATAAELSGVLECSIAAARQRITRRGRETARQRARGRK